MKSIQHISNKFWDTITFQEHTKEKKDKIISSLCNENDYEKALQSAKKNLKNLSHYRKPVGMIVSRWCHVGMTESVQDVFVILIMKKFALTSTSKINIQHIKTVLNDLIEASTTYGRSHYNITKDDDHLRQIIGAIEKVKDPMYCIGDGIDRYNKRLQSQTKSRHQNTVLWNAQSHNYPQNEFYYDLKTQTPYNNKTTTDIENLSLNNMPKNPRGMATPFIWAKNGLFDDKLVQQKQVEYKKDYGITFPSGKWLIYCKPNEINDLWAKVKAGICDGTFKQAKCNVIKDGNFKERCQENQDKHCIMIYVEDYNDKAEILKMYAGLVRKGIIKSGENIPFKRDNETNKEKPDDIDSNNPGNYYFWSNDMSNKLIRDKKQKQSNDEGTDSDSFSS